MFISSYTFKKLFAPLIGFTSNYNEFNVTWHAPNNVLLDTNIKLCKIWGFHDSDYEERRLLGCYIV
jgi:hypothetical protein